MAFDIVSICFFVFLYIITLPWVDKGQRAQRRLERTRTEFSHSAGVSPPSCCGPICVRLSRGRLRREAFGSQMGSRQDGQGSRARAAGNTIGYLFCLEKPGFRLSADVTNFYGYSVVLNSQIKFCLLVHCLSHALFQNLYDLIAGQYLVSTVHDERGIGKPFEHFLCSAEL